MDDKPNLWRAGRWETRRPGIDPRWVLLFPATIAVTGLAYLLAPASGPVDRFAGYLLLGAAALLEIVYLIKLYRYGAFHRDPQDRA